MPNTLAHIGAQGLASRPLITAPDLKWVYLGCIIPDIPWILNRIVGYANLGVNLYDLRLYSIVQSSLLFSLILSLALSVFAIQVWKVFAILGINSLLHLLLDATQIKWANGVVLFAPFSWHLTNYGFYWPESILTYLLACLGVVFFIITWKKGIAGNWDLNLKSPLRYIGSITLIIAFFILPLFLLKAPQNKDNHFVKTLRDVENRVGKYVEMERKSFDANTMTIKTFAGENINVKGVEVNKAAVLSIRGTFIAQDTILVSEFHVHNAVVRDWASYMGLSLVLLFWIYAIKNQSDKRKRGDLNL